MKLVAKNGQKLESLTRALSQFHFSRRLEGALEVPVTPSGHSDTVPNLWKVLPSINQWGASQPVRFFRLGDFPGLVGTFQVPVRLGERTRTVHQLQWLGLINRAEMRRLPASESPGLRWPSKPSHELCNKPNSSCDSGSASFVLLVAFHH
jgi:hypothetical protein